MNAFSHLQCAYCNREYPPDQLINLCPECGKPILARYDLEKLKNTRSKNVLKTRPEDMWRYEEVLPVQNMDNRVFLGEGYTPLQEAKNLGKYFNFSNLYIKDESLNPTTSFKARGLAMAVSRAKELGVKSLSIPSAGNAAGAMSAYAAKAGIEAHVYMPGDVPLPFVVECQLLGAEVHLIDGLITDCGKAAAEDVKKFGRFDLSTLKEPYRIEGKKTMGYEIAEQMDWQLPDVIIYPTGGGTGLIGMWKAFAEMQILGWIEKKLPRMVSVQTEGCAPIVRAFEEKTEFAAMWQNAHTGASGLRVPAAVGDFLILNAIRESNGSAIAVSEAEMFDSTALVGKMEGIFAAPEGGATLAAFIKLRKSGWIKDDEAVVLFNTGSGHKYAPIWYDV